MLKKVIQTEAGALPTVFDYDQLREMVGDVITLEEKNGETRELGFLETTPKNMNTILETGTYKKNRSISRINLETLNAAHEFNEFEPTNMLAFVVDESTKMATMVNGHHTATFIVKKNVAIPRLAVTIFRVKSKNYTTRLQQIYAAYDCGKVRSMGERLLGSCVDEKLGLNKVQMNKLSSSITIILTDGTGRTSDPKTKLPNYRSSIMSTFLAAFIDYEELVKESISKLDVFGKKPARQLMNRAPIRGIFVAALHYASDEEYPLVREFIEKIATGQIKENGRDPVSRLGRTLLATKQYGGNFMVKISALVTMAINSYVRGDSFTAKDIELAYEKADKNNSAKPKMLSVPLLDSDLTITY